MSPFDPLRSPVEFFLSQREPHLKPTMVFSSSRPKPLQGRTILQIIPELNAGGAERTTVDIAEGLTSAGARALVATTGGRLIGELQAKGGIWVPFPAATENPLAMAANIGKLVRLIREEDVDLVHARSRAPAWVAFAAARVANKGFVTTYHGAYAGGSAAKVLYNSVMARGDIVIANSRFTAGMIEKTYQIDPARLRVIHRGTNLEAFSPEKVGPDRVERVRRGWLASLTSALSSWRGG